MNTLGRTRARAAVNALALARHLVDAPSKLREHALAGARRGMMTNWKTRDRKTLGGDA